MWTHWSYKNDPSAYLEQGDVLQNSKSLKELLATYHPYYASNQENRFYIVLTQSCDLVVRGAKCNARYISIAPVRSLKIIVHREFEDKLNKIDVGAPFSSYRTKGEIERFLERLFNNNEPSYYYLEAEPSAGISDPMCAVLTLPIAFKAEHYDVLLNSRIISIEDSFQAKLGSLLGQSYSRVGTKDFDQADLKSKVDEITDILATWHEPSDVDKLKELIEARRTNDPNESIDSSVIGKLIQQIPKKKTLAIERILNIAAELNLASNPSSQRRGLRLRLESDQQFSSLFK